MICEFPNKPRKLQDGQKPVQYFVESKTSVNCFGNNDQLCNYYAEHGLCVASVNPKSS